jgi:hypothetical protein
MHKGMVNLYTLLVRKPELKIPLGGSRRRWEDVIKVDIEVRNYENVEWIHLRFDVFTALKICVIVLWIMTPCSMVGGYQRFGGAYCLQLHSRKMEAEWFSGNVGNQVQEQTVSQFTGSKYYWLCLFRTDTAVVSCGHSNQSSISITEGKHFHDWSTIISSRRMCSI